MGGKSKTTQTSTTNPSTVYGAQDPYLQDMYSQAQNTYRQQSGQTWVPGQQTLNPNYQGGEDSYGSSRGALNWGSPQGSGNYFGDAAMGGMVGVFKDAYGQNGFGGGGVNTTDQYLQGQGSWQQQQGFQPAGSGALNSFEQMLGQARGQMGQAGQGYGRGYQGLGEQAAWLKQFQNPGMDPMADVYAKNVAQNFNEQIMPGLRGGAALAGGMGSSRQGISEGLAAGRSSQQLQDFAAQLYGQQMDRSLQAAGQLGQNAMGYGQLANGQGNLGEQMSGLGGQYGALSQMQQALPWYALNQYKGLLGNPTVLSGGGQSSATATGGGSTLGDVAKIAGVVAAPFTGGASLAVTAAAGAL